MQKERKPLERRQFKPIERPCIFPRKRRINQIVLLIEKAAREDVEEIISKVGGEKRTITRDLTFVVANVERMGMMQNIVGLHGRLPKR